MQVIDPEELVDIYNSLDSQKSDLRNHWQELSDYMAPTHQSIFTGANPGGKRMSKIYDSTALQALDTFANGLYGHLTSPASPWFELTAKNKSIAEVANVKYWLADTTERMRAAINTSNAASAFRNIYYQQGWLGTGVLYIGPGKRYLINFKTYNIANCCIQEDEDGFVDSIYITEKYSCRNMISKWGDKCSKQVKEAFDKKERSKLFDVLWAVFPRSEYNWRKYNTENMKFASISLEKEAKNILNESGYPEFPFAVPRWEKEDNTPYGRSRAMVALPDTKMLQQMCYDNMRGFQKLIDPTILASKESSLSSTRTVPGGIIYHKSGEKPEPLITGGRIDWGLEVEDRRRQIIEKAFYTNLFMLLAENTDPKTAYETSKLIEEKFTILGPALGNQSVEFFDPTLNRVFWTLYRTGNILPPPQELMGKGLEINYIGRLALAMKSVETQAAVNTITIAKDLYELKPDILDNFDTDEFIQGTALRNGTPIKYMRPPDARDKIRADRAQQQQQQADTETALAVAGQIPNLSKAPEPGSPMEKM